MSYINNMNPRRMIWFNQNAPKNKMDLWLSYNRHYEDTSDDETTDAQETTDNPSQRNCDLILKAWDCGKWIPIVGFNTTAANKIDIVEGTSYTPTGESQSYSGKTLYHPAIFTDESPNELYDAGSLGSLLSNSNFVTSQEWQNVFNSQNFQNAWSTVINNIPIRRATASALGGVWADTFATVAANGFAQCKFKGSSDSNLYVSGSDIIGAINAYYTSGGTTPIDIQLANTTDIGGIKADVHSSGVTASRLVEVKLFPTGNTNYERLSVNSDDIIDDIVSTFSDDYPLLLGGNGITLGQTLDHSQITWEVSNLRYAEAGKYARSLVVNGNHTIEWVDLPEGTVYTSGILIDVDNTNDTIGIDASGASNGDVIICDSGVAKWGAVPNPTISGTSINCNNGGVTLNDLQLTSDTSIIIDLEQSSSRAVYNLSTWNYYNLSNCKTLSITSVADTMEPVYIRIISAPYGITCNGDKIDIGSVLTDTSSKDILVTLQFGVAKFEEII